MSWEAENSMGYYGAGYAAEYEEQDEYEPPQRQQSAPRSPGLRSHIRAITTENKALKKELEDQKAALAELMEGDGHQPSHGAPTPRLTDAERLQYERMQAMGVVGVAAPAGTQAEQIARINAARSPEELMDYLRSQGNTSGTGSYNGMGY